MSLPPLIPLRHFFDNPERLDLRVSPDGTRISYLAPENGFLNVWVATIGEDDARCVTHDHVRGIPPESPIALGYAWSRDAKRILYLQDEGGNENHHLWAVDLDSPDAPARDLTPYDGVKVLPAGFPRETPSKVLVAMNRRNPQLFDIYRIDLDGGGEEVIGENPGDVLGWVADATGRVRGAYAQRPDGSSEIRVRDDESAPWRSAGTWASEDEPAPFGFLPDGNLWVASSRGAELKRLVRIDLATGAETLLDSDEESDLENVIQSERSHELLGAVYRRDRLVVHAFDPGFSRAYERLRTVHPGDPKVGATDDEDALWAVEFDDPRDPAHYLYDSRTGEATLLFRARPWLDPAHLAPMEAVSLRARDDLTLHGYLTTPVGVEAKGLPAVLLVHGGPWWRDVWGYAPSAQFLANRGYAVLQVNFRASTGYGKRFLHAGDKEWGRAMLHDLLDSVEWLVSGGVADPARIAIMGGSYGGYATLSCLTFAPDVFAAGVSQCGPSSLVTFIEAIPPYWVPLLEGVIYPRVGNPTDAADRAMLEERSPLHHIDGIRAPLLIGQGANDPRVTQRESDQIVEALRSRGVDVEYIVKDDEGHGFLKPENKLDFMAAVERFLARHLGGRSEQDQSPK